MTVNSTVTPVSEHARWNGTANVLAPLNGLTLSVDRHGTKGLSRACTTTLEHLALLGAAVVVNTEVHGKRDTGDVIAMSLSGCEIALEVQLSGWGIRGEVPFHETLAQARFGLAAIHGRGEGRPDLIRADYISVLAGTTTALAILAGMFAQRNGGSTRSVSLAASHIAAFATARYVDDLAAAPDMMAASTNAPICRPPFTSADGVRFEVAATSMASWQRFWETLGVSTEAIERTWRLIRRRCVNGTTSVATELRHRANTVTFSQILTSASATGTSVCRVRTIAERRADPTLWPMAGSQRPWTLRPTGPHVGTGWSPPGRPDLPLAGLTVIDATATIDGALAAHLLRLLGAEVIRVIPPGGDPLHTQSAVVWLGGGKHTVEIDLDEPSGRLEILELIGKADVFLHDWEPATAASRMLTTSDLYVVNPALVHARTSGWGDTFGAEAPLGTECMVQAYSGVADVVAGHDRLGRPSVMNLLDTLNGFVAAEGVLAALIAGRTTGVTHSVDVSMLSAATSLISKELRDSQTSAPAAADMIFLTSDGYLAVAATTQQHMIRLAATAGLDPKSANIELLSHIMMLKSAKHWEATLRSRGVPAIAVVEDISSLPDDEMLSGLFSHDGLVTAPWRFGG